MEEKRKSVWGIPRKNSTLGKIGSAFGRTPSSGTDGVVAQANRKDRLLFP